MPEPSPPLQAGVLLAAGRSRRMGTPKQLLAVLNPAADGEVPMVARAFDLLAIPCGPRVVVVTGHEAEKVAAALAGRVFTHAASDPDADMLCSVRSGLSRAFTAFPEADRVWLHLADHPFVRDATLGTLVVEFESRPDRRAVLPTYHGRGGHPVLIPRSLLPHIINWRGEEGLRSFWIQHPSRIARVEVNDPGVVNDLDTPQQYDDATRRAP